jgi:hypothetical protein
VEESPIKSVLYCELNQISESKIQLEFSKNNHAKIIKEILDRCIPKILKIKGNSYENLGTFAESIMHYLLTNALIPSQRKVTIKNIKVDVVIPDSKTLVLSPENVLILYFVKSSDMDSVVNYLEKLQEIQPIRENIWLISKTKCAPYKTYEIENTKFAAILDDINGFLVSKPQSKFRIFKT